VVGRRLPPPSRRRCRSPPCRWPPPPSPRRRPTAAGRAEAPSPSSRRRVAAPVGCHGAASRGMPVTCNREVRGSRRGVLLCRFRCPLAARGRRGASDTAPPPRRAQRLGRRATWGRRGRVPRPFRCPVRCHRGATRRSRRPRRRHSARRRQASLAPRGNGDAAPPPRRWRLPGRRVPGLKGGCAA